MPYIPLPPKQGTVSSTAGGAKPYVPLPPKGSPQAATTQATPDTQKYTDYLKSGYGASNITDTSGAPLLTFRNDAAKKSQLLSDRTYSGDPTVAKPGSVQNQRMPVAQSQAIKKAAGGTNYQELDHIQPLELGGSNQKSNLQLEPGKNPSKPYGPSNPTKTDPIENQVADQVRAGKITQLQGWQQIAKVKGIPLAEAQKMALPVAGKSVVPQTKPKSLVDKANGALNAVAKAYVPGLEYAEKAATNAAGALQKGVDSVKGKGINNLVNKAADKLAGAAGEQAVEHPLQTFKSLATEIGQQEDTGIHRLVDSFKAVKQNAADSASGKPVNKTRALADAVNLLHAGASLALMPVSVPFEIGSKLPVFKPAFDAVGVVFDQAGKVTSYEADKTLGIIPDRVLSPEQKSILAQPVHDVASLAGQILLGGKVLHEITAYTEAHGPLTDAKAKEFATQYRQEAEDLNTHVPTIEKAVQSGDVTKINAALESSKAPKAKTAADFVASKDAKLRVADDLNNESLTTKILDKLKGRDVVSKQFIEDLTNSPDLKQSERDLIRSKLADQPDKIDVPKFAEEVKAELLPLKRKAIGNPSYENISLPEEVRGNIKNYSEHIYESPIITSAGDVHFSGETQNYFGHSRVEDVSGSTRRVLEVQSDLYQKGRLENEKMRYKASPVEGTNPALEIQTRRFGNTEVNPAGTRASELAKLDPYQNNAAHFRMIREEVRQAALDGKTKLQFPTGETAMKIEGLGETSRQWSHGGINDAMGDSLTAQSLSNDWIGETVNDGNSDWVITDVLGDGKFKAVPRHVFEEEGLDPASLSPFQREVLDETNASETFDISGKVDTSNPIYRFYEKDVARYLKNKYDTKLVTDAQGVKWMEVDVNPEHKGPVEAFRLKDDLAKKGIEITDDQEKKIIALNKELFGDADVRITGQILANKEALGKYESGIIDILKGQEDHTATFYHEAVHKYLDVFTDRAEHAAILEEGAKKYGITDYAQVEEKIAEDFIKYAETREGVTGKLKTYFDTIIGRIQGFLGNQSKIDQLYTDILSGKAKDAVKESGFAKSIADEAGKRGTKVEETADYRSSTEKEQADLFEKTAESGIDKVRAIVRGDTPLPEYARGGSFLFELEKYIKENPSPDNAEIAYEMANSPLATGVSEAASELGLLQKRHQDSYTAKVDDLKRKLTEAAGGKDKVAANRRAFKEKASRVLLPKEELSWDRFLSSIQC